MYGSGRKAGGAISTCAFVVVCGRSAMASASPVGEAREMDEGLVVRGGCAETSRRMCRKKCRDCVWN